MGVLLSTLLAALLLAEVPSKPRLKTSAFPVMQTADLGRGCSNVLLRVELLGPETEDWYCPKVEWIRPDGTQFVEESDCPPFEQRWMCKPMRGAECTLDWHIDARGQTIVDNNPCDCTVPGYPRIWRHTVCAPAHPYDELWEVEVRISKGKKSLSEKIRFGVK